jgi:glycosyltransferase involved in cell wall biosynthesis
MPKVSVVVPVFEPGPLIEPLIASLLVQTMPAGERELVFVDDGSRDGTAERLDTLAAEHLGVRVLHIPNSGWAGRPRNVGLDAARGEFVFFADHDDWLDPEAL